MSFDGKVVLVTGASSGIGAAIAISYAKEGANVAIVGRNQSKLDKVASECAKNPLVINADVSVDAEGKRIVEETVKAFGKLDILVNNAGMGKFGSILDGTILEAYDVTMKINLRAIVNITTVAAPHLQKTKGNIINISSVAAIMPPASPGVIPYAVSKAALDHFTQGAAIELAPSGIRVNSVNPGPVYTDFLDNAGIPMKFDNMIPMTALNRVSTPDEIADMVLYLSSDKARGITGSKFVVDNGMILKKN